MPRLVNLTTSQQMALMVVPAMYYDVDGDYIMSILVEAGIVEVNPVNLTEALGIIRRKLEQELWQDNVGKQILGDIL